MGQSSLIFLDQTSLTEKKIIKLTIQNNTLAMYQFFQPLDGDLADIYNLYRFYTTTCRFLFLYTDEHKFLKKKT